MLRGLKRVRNSVAVLPTMAAHPMAPEASGPAEPARSAREDALKSLVRTSRSSTSDGPTQSGRPTNSRRLYSQRVINLQCRKQQASGPGAAA